MWKSIAILPESGIPQPRTLRRREGRKEVFGDSTTDWPAFFLSVDESKLASLTLSGRGQEGGGRRRQCAPLGREDLPSFLPSS